MACRKNKNAKVPKNVWNDRRDYSKKFGLNNALEGFILKDKLMNGQFIATPKKGKRYRKVGKRVFEIEVDWE